MNGTTQKLAQERKKRGDSGIEPQRAGTVQYLLTPQVQLRLDGTSEPVSEILVPVPEIEAPEVDSKQRSLFEIGPLPQADLPLHLMEDGKPDPECIRGWRMTSNASSPEERRVVCLTCGLRGCQSSEHGNGAKRAQKAWDDALRLIAGHDVDLCILTVTSPERLRGGLGSREEIQTLRKNVAHAVMKEWLPECVDSEDPLFYLREYFHPVGEDSLRFHPHYNLLIPAVYFDKAQGRGRGFDPWRTQEELSRLREIVAEVFSRTFGQSVDPSEINVYWQYEDDETEKRHMLKYNSRLKGFSAWNELLPRPAVFGLAHAKNRDLFEAAIETKGIKPLSEWVETSEHIVSATGQTEEQAVESLERKCELHRSECLPCFSAFEARRTNRDAVLCSISSNHRDGQTRSTADPPLQALFGARFTQNSEPNLSL